MQGAELLEAGQARGRVGEQGDDWRLVRDEGAYAVGVPGGEVEADDRATAAAEDIRRSGFVLVRLVRTRFAEEVQEGQRVRGRSPIRAS